MFLLKCFTLRCFSLELFQINITEIKLYNKRQTSSGQACDTKDFVEKGKGKQIKKYMVISVHNGK